jgi:hypothetical protein
VDLGHAPAPSRAQLTRAIVDAAHAWAALAMESSEAIDPRSEEGRLRLALIDAVHDAEHYDVTGGIAAPIQLDMFREPPGN